MHYYPDNTITHYTTRLENALTLSGDWEVGLVEIQYQHTWYNLELMEGRVLYYHSFEREGQTKLLQDMVQVPAGYYETVPDVIQVINDQMKESAENLAIDQFAELKYSNKTNRLTVDLGRHTSITFTPAMRYMLGISHLRHPLRNSTSDTIQWTSAKSCDIHRGFTSMYVYCDVLEHVSVGDTKAPLLRIVQVCGKSGERVQAVYDKPIYVPLQKKNFDSIEIDIRNDIGKPIPFENGKVIVTLHFRLSKIPYLLQ